MELRSTQSPDTCGLVAGDPAVANSEPVAASDTRARGKYDLDRLIRNEIKAQDPGRGRTRKDSVRRQQTLPCPEKHHRILADAVPAIEL